MSGKPRHGYFGTPTYNSWSRMSDRCSNPKNIGWHRYGGRGVKVCERWRDFKVFLADMGKRPSVWHFLDRIDNDGNYEPSNCRWATKKEQALNRPSTRWLSFGGKRLSIRDWATEVGLDENTLWARIKTGWSVERALSTPCRPIRRG